MLVRSRALRAILLGSTALAVTATLTWAPASAADCVVRETGNWNDPATWTNCFGAFPAGYGDTAKLDGNHVLTVTAAQDVDEFTQTDGTLRGEADLTITYRATFSGGGLEVVQGKVTLLNESTFTNATIDVAEGAVLELSGWYGGQHQFSGVGNTGPGTVRVDAVGGLLHPVELKLLTPTAFGTLEVPKGRLSVNAPSTVQTLVQDGFTSLHWEMIDHGMREANYSVISGDHDLTVTGAAFLLGGDQTGSGTTIVEGTATIGAPFLVRDGNYDYYDPRYRPHNEYHIYGDRHVVVKGGGSFEGESGLFVLLYGTLWNADGSLLLNNTSLSLGGWGGGLFVNEGTFRNSGNFAEISATLDNPGMVEVEQGFLVLTGPVLQLAGDTLQAGTWRVLGDAATAEIAFFGMGFVPIANLGADVTLSGADSRFCAGDAQTYGCWDYPPDSRTSDLEDSLSTILDGGALRVLGARDFDAANALTNTGTIELGGGRLTAPALTNLSTGEIIGFGGIAPTIFNSGLVSAVGGTLTAESGIIAASGTVAAEDGATVAIQADSSAETLNLRGGSIDLDTHNFHVSGLLSGSGAFTGTGTVMLDGGTFSPGGSPGLMTFEGDFDLSQALGSDFFIGGTVRGSEYSGADVGGTLTLGGDLTLTLGDGFAPALRDVFTLFTATRIDGDFLGFAFPELAQGLRFEEWRTDTEYGVHVTPLPASVWFLGSALAALGAAAARRRRTQARTQAAAA